MQFRGKDKEKTMAVERNYRGQVLLFAVMLLLLQPEIYARQVREKFTGRTHEMIFSRPVLR